MRRVPQALIVAGLAVAAGLWIYRPMGPGSRPVAFDLAGRLPFAARASAREVIVFGWPDAEPHLVKGFGGDPESRGRERFLWVRQGASLRIELEGQRDRALIFDVEAYPGIEGQQLSIVANGRSLGVQGVPPTRSRIRFDWPAAAQSAVNEVVLQFSRSIVPAEEKGGSGDTRDFAAAMFSLTLGDQNDDTLELLLGREAPRAYAITEKAGVPSLTLPGASRTSFAFRLPEAATLEFESALHPWSAASGARGTLQIALDSTDGKIREGVQIPLGGQLSRPTVVTLGGKPGTPFIVRMEVISDNPGITFAQIRAPRILGLEPAARTGPGRPALRFREDLAGLKPNVVLIVLDAARALALGSYGHSRDTSPNIDRFSREGFTFDNAYTTAAYTLAAMSSVWTSQQPDRHHGDVAFSARLPVDRLMLAEVLAAQGIHTAGFVANGVAGAFNGFDRGFQEFNEPWKKFGSQAASFRKVVPPFLDRMKKEGRRFFAYVHYREPHQPYDPPPPFNTAFGPDAPIPKSRREGGAAADKWLHAVNQGVIKPTVEEVDHLRRLYDGNLAFADQEVGFLRSEMEARGLLDNTVVIIIGDHGEALFEHAFIGHNTQVFEETARIPLILALPQAMRGANPPARIAALVDLTDLAPTILDIFGLAGTGGSARAFQGQSLLPRLANPAAEGEDSREVLTRTVWDRPIYALRNAGHTFIYNTATAEFSLFDRTTSPRLEDPEHDYAARAPIALRETYRQDLLAWVASLKTRAVSGDTLEGMSRENCEELKSLGYLAAGMACPKS